MRIIVAGWRAARQDRHGEIIAEGLAEAVDGALTPEQSGGAHVLVHGDNPHGGVDEIAAKLAAGWGWRIDDRGHQRSEVSAGTGTGNYRQMCQDGADLVVLFPGTNDTDAREAYLWAVRYGIPFIGFPLDAVAKR